VLHPWAAASRGPQPFAAIDGLVARGTRVDR
jgi:hypothetical protein